MCPFIFAAVQNYLLFATESELHQISLDTPTLVDVSARLGNFRDASSVTVDIAHDQIYWTERLESKIFTAPLSSLAVGGSGGVVSVGGELHPQAVVSYDLVTPEAVVVDWIGRNLYWADSGTGTIEVLDLEGGARRVLVKGLVQVTSLALDLVSR